MAIEAAAKRVGVGLAPSYVAFLAVSDGAYANGCGVVTRSSEYGLLPAGDICRLVDVAPDHVALWVETFAGVDPESRGGRADGQEVRSFARFGDAVLLTPMIDADDRRHLRLPGAGPARARRRRRGFRGLGDVQRGRHPLPHLRAAARPDDHDAVGRPNDELVRSLLPDVTEQLVAVDQWAADPDYHWCAVRQVRRLAAAPRHDERVALALDQLWDGGDPYLRLAAAQADLGYRRDRARERLAWLAAPAGRPRDEPTVSLAAAATLRVCDHPLLRAAAP